MFPCPRRCGNRDNIIDGGRKGKQETKKESASAGNRTRAARVAGEHSTTEPPMLVRTTGLQALTSDGTASKPTS